MKLSCAVIPLLLLLSLATRAAQQQEIPDPIQIGFVDKASARIERLNQLIERKNQRYLAWMKRQEKRLLQKVQNTGNLSAENVDSLYERVLAGVQNAGNTTAYDAFLDTLSTSLAFLEPLKAHGQQLKHCEAAVQQLKGRLAQSEHIQQFLEMRKQSMRQLLQGKVKIPSALKKRYAKVSETVFYYKAQVNEYRQLLKDGSKMEQKAFELLSELPAFQKFMRENSELASLFPLPGGTPDATALIGLQTRSSMEQLLNERLGAAGAGGASALQTNLSAARAELQKLRDAVNGLTGEEQDFDLPDFKPNSQKTKTFLDRIEWGFDIEFERSSSLLPATADMGFSAGYKLNDRSIVGVGLAYKMGMGTLSRIRVTHEGVGVRSFLDWKIRKKFWISGGWEMNHLAAFKNLEQLQHSKGWQSNALLGVSKRYRISDKVQGEMKLMYDFLYREHVPVSQPVILRLGYRL